jgi:N-acetylglucosaminyldiphosphoundecaprenol N-acetyl-beta-D-mannosaminyltransferase
MCAFNASSRWTSIDTGGGAPARHASAEDFEAHLRKLLVVLGVPVASMTMAEVLDRIDDFVRQGRASGRSHQIATVNADFIVNALHDPELRTILREADLGTVDGMPVVWGARMLGVPVPGRVTGADLVPAIAERAAAQGYSIFLLGALPGVGERTAAILRERHPDLQIAGVLAPTHVSLLETDPTLLETLRAARPDILLVALGNPKQEKWISQHAHELQIPVCMGVGGTFDLIAGVTQRAPLWMQRAGLEWLYRLAQEPRRLWRRYVNDMLHFGPLFLRQWWALRRPGAAEPLTVEAVGPAQLRLHGSLYACDLPALLQLAAPLAAAGEQIVLDMGGARAVDASALGALMMLANRARASGGRLALANLPPAIARALRLAHLEDFFDQIDDEAAAPPTDYTVRGWLVAAMPERLDSLSAPQVLERYRDQVAETPLVIVDLSVTQYVSSGGMAALLAFSKRVCDAGGEVRIAGGSSSVQQSLRQMRLDTHMPLHASVREAALAGVERLLAQREVGAAPGALKIGGLLPERLASGRLQTH